MAEGFAIAASAIAVIQITDRIVQTCRFFIGSTQDAPADLRVILVEISALRPVLENLDFLATCTQDISDNLRCLSGPDGPVAGCKKAAKALDALLPNTQQFSGKQNAPEKDRIKAILAALRWPLKQKNVKRLLEEIGRYKDTINLAITADSIHDIKTIKTRTADIHEMLTESQRRDVLSWLAQASDPSQLHARACGQYQPGTGDWMSRSRAWSDWLATKTRYLWIHGIPGSGKTVLVSYLIEHVKSHLLQARIPKPAFAYYYCYFGHERDETAPLLRWILTQFCRQAEHIPEDIYAVYRGGDDISLKILLSSLAELLEHFETAVIIIDALDESRDRLNLLQVLNTLATDTAFSKLQVVAASREYTDIEKCMKRISLPISMYHSTIEDDIRHHVRSVLASHKRFKRWPQHLLDEVIDVVPSEARGMYRWAVCQMDILQRLRYNSENIKQVLKNLPKTLEETYDRIFQYLDDDDRLFVLHVLQWIAFHNDLYGSSSRDYNGNLSSSLLTRLASESSAEHSDSHIDRFYDTEDLEELCGCLVRVSEQSQPYQESNLHAPSGYSTEVNFAHFTVREYLNGPRLLKRLTGLSIDDEYPWNQILLRFVFGKVLALDAHTVKRWQGADDTVEKEHDEYALNLYSAMSCFISITRWELQICQYNDIWPLVFEVMDPTKEHFNAFMPMVPHIQALAKFFGSRDTLELSFLSFKWNTKMPFTSAHTLWNVLSHALTYYASSGTRFAQKFLQAQKSHDFLSTRLTLVATLALSRSGADQADQYLDGSIIELFAQIRNSDPEALHLLLQYGVGHYDPSKILALYALSHSHNVDCYKTCSFVKLLDEGADPNGNTSRVSPLQIAVSCREPASVLMLIAAGADPNGLAGLADFAWGKSKVPSRFEGLIGMSPLYICRNFESTEVHENQEIWRENKDKIEAILLNNHAIEFREDSDWQEFDLDVLEVNGYAFDLLSPSSTNIQKRREQK